MVKRFNWEAALLFWALVLALFAGGSAVFAVEPHIYDNAGLLTEREIVELEALAAELSEKQDADFLFLTTDSTDGQSIISYMGDFFDDWAEENNQENAVLLTIDMGSREVYLAGFGTAETKLDNDRVQQVLDRIMPYMGAGDYGGAFRETVTTASRYMEFRPGANPESIIHKLWFQAGVPLLAAAVIVGSMVMNAGGRVTTTARTYVDGTNTRVRSQQDRFRNKTVSRRRVPKSNGGGGGFGGGGGMTGGGRSFSGGGRSF
ncbi:hypothetical protein BN1080_02739 [Planococcus massiliensis]|uniref:TPM domain-containing protein n=1 Tax=Planococcus massiliensis TaxID=1499687 RepID=A0A098EPK4_9BACL|nr:TPM domain-containing protein [Planococcus massiliensis]CEG23735.1 hypothetical protein BN1080_02739 [Planococcus massiliensis]